MNWPIDGPALVIAERSGVEIAHCPKCWGVWLDRGEFGQDHRAQRELHTAASVPV